MEDANSLGIATFILIITNIKLQAALGDGRDQSSATLVKFLFFQFFIP